MIGRRLMFLALSVVAALLMLAGVALAARALAGKRYSGIGQEYENNGPHFETFKGFKEPMTLTVSSNGDRVRHFKGSYVAYCGAVHASVVGNGLKISPSGRFGGTGSKPAYFNGQHTGTDYFVLRGKFVDGGKKASVTYQATFVGLTQTDPHPYSLSFQPPADSCQNKVTGTVRTK